jgi:thioredoxin 1
MNYNEFIQKMKANPRPVVVDVWAPWCGPCRMIEPALKRLEQKYTGQVDLLKINADQNRELVRDLKIYGIPTQIVYQGEREVTRKSGAMPESGLEALFVSALTGEQPARQPVAPIERIIRLAIGLLVLYFAYTSSSIILAVIAGLLMFSAVYDRCPIYNALAPRVHSLVKKYILHPNKSQN